ncbi:GspE/PulE family protein [Pseudalkalibacillus sp. Hm43]|uniref:GspE/PulE family protein n=1 Tax=Pseudalkalibacillus sp. Hm43 TaxID=3450742 RepID=UPI003F4420AE
MRIGELLVMNGLITEDQLENALQKQTHSFKKIGEILVEDHLITERQLAEALEFQLGIPVVNMDEIVPNRSTIQLIHEALARKHCFIPIEQMSGKLKVAMVDPLNQEAIKDIQETTGMIVQPCIATRSELEMAIIDHYGVLSSVKELNDIIEYAVQQNASDIHLDAEKDGLSVKYRINQMLEKQKVISNDLKESIIGRIKTIASLNASKRGLPQTGYIHKEAYNTDYDIRVSTVPTINGESAVLKLIDRTDQLLKLNEFGFSENNLKQVESAIDRRSGFVLISGPSMSGKTTSLYSILDHINHPKHKIVSVEQSVDRRLDGITQVEVNDSIGFNFTNGLSTMLTQDPNVIMVSHLEDKQTVEASTRISLSGRLVLGSIHGKDAVGTIRRILDMGIEPYLLATSLTCIVSQRLVRKVCERCAKSMPASDEESKLFEAHGLVPSDDAKSKSAIGNFRSFVTTNKSSKIAVVRGDGCKLCNNTGYKGLVGIHEVLTIDDVLRDMILQNRPAEAFREHLEEKEFQTLLHDGLTKVKEGITTVDDVLTNIQ